ncbi:cation transporter [Actinotalea sp. BY-33]|uniref:Cation transporter n=1 Tax=Actinotalea soli TaxID=2819234 RepID=A0A939RTH6_9CELL|nr:cation transporter [Actinotalea soli]MBO1751164.1 cation transporter [Actinotalea soli]
MSGAVTLTAAVPAPSRRDLLRRRVRLIVAATIGYNVVEAVVAIGAGAAASSTALIGFGLDSAVEVLSATAIAWQFAGGGDHEEREHRALRVVAFSFFALAALVGFHAVRALLGGAEADHSTVGIVLAAVSLVVMPGLAWWERRTGRELGSASVVADSAQLLVCSALSAVLLGGLVATSALGWVWADPVAALVIAAVAVREGIKALRGDTCCSPVALLGPETTELADDAHGCAQYGPGGGCCGPGTTVEPS